MFSAADQTAMIETLANCTVSALLYEVETVSFRAIFRDNVEVSSGYELEQIILKPQLMATSANIAALAGAQTFNILRDGETETKRYAFDGKPQPAHSGLVRVLLAVKK